MRGGGITLALHGVEFYFNYMMTVTPTIVPEEVIFPLKTIEFEGFQLKAPNDTHKFLTVQFGDYMLFPRGGVEHHSAGGLDQRGDRAEKSGTDMDEVLEKLKDMDRFFRAKL